MMRKTSLCVGILLNIIPTIFFLLASPSEGYAQKYVIPDFAFPQTAEKESLQLLKESLENNNDVMALRAVINLCVARNMLTNSESVASNIHLLDSVITKLKSPCSNLALLIESEILNQEYSRNQYSYDSRNLPLTEEFPPDPAEWSGQMYKQRIYELISAATDLDTTFSSDNISSIAILLKDCKTAEKAGMTVDEFILLKASGLLNQISSGLDSSVIPFYPLQAEQSTEGKCQALSLRNLNKVIDQTIKKNSTVAAVAIMDLYSMKPEYEKVNFLKEEYKKLYDTEGAGILLYELWSRERESKALYYENIKRQLEKYPEGYGSEQLEFALSEITKERIEINFPQLALPDTPISGTANLSNIERAFVLVYRLASGEFDEYDNVILKKFSKASKPVQIIEVATNNESIPFDYNQTVDINGLKSGLYVVVPSKTKNLPKDFDKASYNSGYSTIRVSDIAIITSNNVNEKDSGRVYVVKGKDQQPLQGAKVSYYSGADKTPKATFTTNNEGWVKIPNGYYRVKAEYAGNTARGEAGFGYYKDNEGITFHTSLLTDLEVYRPGDTVNYAVVGWKQKLNSNSIVKDKRVAVILRDAGFNEIAKDTLTLNSQGRATGSFIIPEGRLLGSYQLISSYPDLKNQGGGSVQFYVEEYKLPSFIVTLNQTESKDPEIIKFKGEVKTFSGMPLPESKVAVNVEYKPWRWWPTSGNASYSESVTTDSKGLFEFSLPTANLKGTSFEQGRYIVKASATAPSGETQTSSPCNFYLGKGLELRPSIPVKYEIKTDTVSFSVPVYDMAGLPVKTQLKYTVTNPYDSTFNLSGYFESPVMCLESSSLPSGAYKFKFESVESPDSALAETVVWRKKDITAPCPTPLWIPQSEYVFKREEKTIEITFGSYWKEWILMVLSDGEKILKTEWIAPQDSLIKKQIILPDTSNPLFVSLSGMHDFKAETAKISIVSEKSKEKLEIETISFRDKLSAGENEQWKFKFKTAGNPAPYVNAFAVLTDKALNSLYDFKWNINIWTRDIYNRVNLTVPYLSQGFSYATFFPVKQKNYKGYENMLPYWQTYGYPLVSGANYTHGVLYRSLATMAPKNAKMEAAVEVEDAVAEMKMADGAMIEESSQEDGNEMHSDLQLRPVEMPLAFFKSNLEANEEGEISIDFTVPDFNTVWQLQVLGYNDEAMNACLVLDTEASKSVMVRSNLPQFLRTGDKARISATLFNNSEKTLDLGGKIEIIDGATGKVIKTSEFEGVEITPSGNRIISIEFEVPSNTSELISRCYAYGSGHTDGEQGYIPLLPSSMPVTESIPFYASFTQEMVEFKIPKIDNEANVTLKYCDNPLWDVLLSLPGVTQESNSGALSIARWLYGTLTARDIIDRNEEIANGLKAILNSEDSTATKSNLEKDQNLKIVTPEASPWLNSAEKETASIRSLQIYLSPEKLELLVNEKIRALKQLQQPDGGWCWFEGMKSSHFITAEVVRMLGYLNNKGLLDNELEKMMKRAVGFADSRLEENFDKYKRVNTVSAIDYFYYRDMTGVALSSKMKKIKQVVLDSVSNNWIYWSIGEKVKAAMVLLSEPARKGEALTIAESLKEFIGSRIPLYQEALMIDLFRKLPGCSAATEKVMESIYLKKETESWTNNIFTPGIIHSLVGLSAAENAVRTMPEIYIEGESLDLPKAESLTGNYTVNLDPKKISGKKLRIIRQSGIPAWGGIVSQYVAPILDVKARNIENLSVEKHLYKEDINGEIKEVDRFHKGDKVIVVLNLNVNKDMDYVVLADWRPACLQTEDTASGLIFNDGLVAYREFRKDKTTYFIEDLPAGKYVISYSCHADRDGEYSLGFAEAQCLYAPIEVAHTGGSVITID